MVRLTPALTFIESREETRVIKTRECYATAIMSPSVHSEFVTSDKATLS